jgi:hypothetical protein
VRLFKRAKVVESPPEPPILEAAEEVDYFASDTPETDLAEDRLGRADFARRITNMILRKTGYNSTVLGVFGEWGEGKTSVLRFVETTLRAEHRHETIPIWFNPWRLGDETQLMTAFFQTLSHELKASLESKGQLVGQWIRDYGAALLPSLSLGGVVSVSYNESVKSIGEALAASTLEERKLRIDHALRHSGKRIVVFMDDLDRLDKHELYLLFKLLKLTANFACTVYVVALDPTRVADAVSEMYGQAGDSRAGLAFLDKIIQIPIQVPLADQSMLTQICFQQVNEALRANAVTLTGLDAQRFVTMFDLGLGPVMKTPRLAKRYGNVLRFSLGLVKGHVDYADFMLVEGLRIMFPSVYFAVRDHPDAFVRYPDDSGRVVAAGNGFPILTSLNEEVRRGVLDLLGHLFPRLRTPGLGEQWESVASRENRVASPDCFERYFSYQVTSVPVSSRVIDNTIDMVRLAPLEDVVERIRVTIDHKSADQFVRRLGSRVPDLDTELASQLALAISRLGAIWPRQSTAPGFTTFDAASKLVADLIGRVNEGDRVEIAKAVASEGYPIAYAVRCIAMLEDEIGSSLLDQPFKPGDATGLISIVVGRIRSGARDPHWWPNQGEDAGDILEWWAAWTSRSETNEYVSRSIVEYPWFVNILLSAFRSAEGIGIEETRLETVGSSNSLTQFDRSSDDTGEDSSGEEDQSLGEIERKVRGPIDDDSVDYFDLSRMAQVVDLESVFAAVTSLYGQEHPTDGSPERDRAMRFTTQYRRRADLSKGQFPIGASLT